MQKIDLNYKIELNYKIAGGLLKVEIIEHKKNAIVLNANYYKLKNYKNKTKLYNEMLDDFQAEYNADKSYLLDIVCNNLEKNV